MSLQRLSLSEFKQNMPGIPDGELPEPEILIPKACLVSEVKAVGKDSERALQFLYSDGTVDRDDDDINPKGWDLKDFKKSGVLLWAHDSRLPPIARPKETWVDSAKAALMGIAQFTPPDMNHPLGMGFGYTIYRMYKEKYLHAVSVGFQPIKWKVAEDRVTDSDSWNQPISFLKQKLLEVSPVPIPANGNALVEASSKGIDLRPILAWTEMELDENTGLVVPRAYAEGVRNELKELCGGGDVVTVPDDVQGEVAGSEAPAEPGAAPDAEAEANGPASGSESEASAEHQVPDPAGAMAPDPNAHAPATASAEGKAEGDGDGDDATAAAVSALEEQVAEQAAVIEALLAGLKALGEMDISATQRRSLRAAMLPFVKSADADADNQEIPDIADDEEIEIDGVDDVEAYVAERLTALVSGGDSD